ncbi:hypothetical protein BaRGS_00005491 [Batillaria attramentaria]|uniref:Apple domain-containing protein n=1 Tax=Batillaria attramentaria TaxID=370345 RepID=A0ABD0LVL5_9CAEN
MVREILIVFAALFCEAGEARTETAQKAVHLGNLIFTDDVLFTVSARSALQCASQCLSVKGCLTFTYTQPSSQSTSCRGHTSVMTSDSTNQTAPGSSFYSFACDSSNLQTEFVLYQNARIRHTNLYVVNRPTLDECQAACITEPQCRSVDYNPTTLHCNVQDVTPLDEPDKWQLGGHDYDYYQRACA